MTTKITITRPDDFHLHLRDGETLKQVLPHSAAEFGRAIIMPNLKPPVTDLEKAIAYRERIIAARPAGSNFEPLMTLYLTEGLTPDEIRKAAASGIVKSVKLYPAGATTNSDAGVNDFSKIKAALETMAEVGLPLCIHGEVTDPNVDVFDREKRFIETTLDPLRTEIPALKVIMEHITTKDAAQYVLEANENLGATITCHHLLMNRNAIFQGGIQPHHYCLPILKRETHRQALVEVATSGNAKFFLGTDSAPHPKSAKESACGCAGMYTAFAAMPFYAEAFDEAGAIDKLEGFASFHGADFYGIPRNSDTITLIKEPTIVPESYPLFDGETIIPLRAGGTINWRMV